MVQAIERTFHCPVCRAQLSVYQEECPDCSSDVALLSQLHRLPYLLFNQGADSWEAGRPLESVSKLSAALELKADFLEARQLLDHVALACGLAAPNKPV